MYLDRKEAEKLLTEFNSSTIDELREKSGFLLDLLKEDDWTFVIKGHAMIEAAVTQLLIEHLGDIRLKSFIQRLPLSGMQTGKVEVAKQLCLLNENHRKFIRWLSKLRNSLVHRIENLDFTFQNHLAVLDKKQRLNWRDSIVGFAEDDNTRKQLTKITMEHPKIVIFMGLYSVISDCTISSQQSRGLRKIDKAARKTTEFLLKESCGLGD